MPTFGHRARRLLVLALNVCLVTALLLTASVRFGTFPRARAGLGPNTIVLTMEMNDFEYRLENDRTVVFTGRGTGRAHLARAASQVLSRASVQYEFPRLGLSGTLTEEAGKPGVYRITQTERVRVEASVPFRTTRDWSVENIQVSVDGEELQTRVKQVGNNQYHARNWFRHDVTGHEVRPYGSPARLEVQARVRVQARFKRGDGSPAAGVSVTVSLPDRGYRETFTTDADGWLHISRVETGYLTLQGGSLLSLAAPLEVEEPEEPQVLFWWEEPEERCEVDARLIPEHGAATPGSTAIYDFEVP